MDDTENCIIFTDEEKIQFFDELKKNFMGKNFSRITKSDVEILLFHFYIRKLITMNCNDDNIIDYSGCSDYILSNELGITQQRVRNLKIKNQLIYREDFDWKKSFSSIVQNARYDEKKGKIIIGIPDPNLYIEIQNHLENQGQYIETQLNRKVMQIRVEYFIDLVLSIGTEEDRKEVIKELKKQFKKQNKDKKYFENKNIGEAVVDCCDTISSVAEFLNKVIEAIPSHSLSSASLIPVFFKSLGQILKLKP